MLKIFKRKRESKPTHVIFWTNCDIPAKLFFDIMHTGDYSKLGTDTPAKLEAAFDGIFDEYTTISNNLKVANYLNKNKKISDIVLQINGIEETISVIEFVPMTQAHALECVEILNRYKAVKPKFDPKAKDILKEINRIKTSVLGILRNQLNQLIDGLPKQKEKVANEYHHEKIILQSVHGYVIPDSTSLYEWVEYIKVAKEKQQPVNTKKNGR